MRANLSLMGMYYHDNTILDNLVIPTGIDSDTLKENLLMEAAELEVLYTDFDFLKMAIGSWSKKQLPIWTELLKTTQYEYNPIWNKDGSISEVITRNLATSEDVSDVNTRTHADTDTRTNNNTDTRTHADTDTRTNNNTDTRTHLDTMTRTLDNTDEQTRNLASTNDITNSHGVFGYNSSAKAPESEDITDQDTSDTGTVTDKHSGTIADAHTGTIADAHSGTIADAHTGTITDAHTGTIADAHTGTITDAHTGTITDAHTGTITDARVIDKDNTDTGTISTYRTEQGNIGLTSTQDLIKQQREVVLFNIMDVIIHDFIDRFCLKIY